MKRFLFSAATVLLPLFSIAQDFPFNNVIAEELSMKRYDKDTSAHAVVLQEYGQSKIGLTKQDYLRLFYEYHVKIKIFDNDGFHAGTVEIPLRLSAYYGDDKLGGLEGVTTFTGDDGKTQTVRLNTENIYNDKKNTSRQNVKFVFPALKSGCVIEYRYKIETPYFSNFKPWFFQSDIPKIYSEYETHIPAFWKFNALIKGPLKLTKNTADAEPKCYIDGTAVADCKHSIYAMNDVPAFVTEEFMTSPVNFLSAVYFELAEYKNAYTGKTQNFAQSWVDVDKVYRDAKSFGGQISQAFFLKSRVKPVIADKTTDLDKARAIYEYVKKTLKWNKFYSDVSDQGFDKTFNRRIGSSGDINISLIAALIAAGINVQPVLLSTREYGAVNKLYPTSDDFDYVIAKVDIGTKSYFLDATEPLLGFGMLPLRCLNGDGRLMNLNGPSDWINIGTDQKKSTITTLDLTLHNNGKINGKFIQYSSGYAAYLKREAIKGFNTIDEYIENHEQPSTGRLRIIKSAIENLDSLDKPVVESYDIEFDLKRDTNDNKLVFNPFTFDHITNNPFRQEERIYPVDMGMPDESRYILTLHLPESFVIEETVKPESVALPNQGGKFVSDFQFHDNLFIYSHITQFSRSVYWPNEYPALKEFYNTMIQSERQNLILKKIK